MFFVVFGGLILARHAGFGTLVFDFGIFDQGLWLLSRFQEPFVTLRGLNLFADHSSYLMVPLVPLYWIWNDPRALLLVTVAVLAVTAPLLYAVGRREGLTPPVAAALAVGYLLHPATQWNTWDNFHPEVLAIPLLIAAYHFAQRRRFGWAVAMLVLVLAAKEDAALVVIPFGVYLGWRWKRTREGVGVVLIGLGGFVLNFFFLLPSLSPTGDLLYSNRYGQFGDGMGGALWGMISQPDLVIRELATVPRLAYLAAMLLPLAVSVLAPEILAIGVPITLANLLSLHGYQHEIKFHYTSYLLALVAVAAVVGARRLLERIGPRWGPALAVGVLVACVVGSVLSGPWPGPGGNPWRGAVDDPVGAAAALSVVPAEAAVSADWFVANHLAHRTIIYQFPNPFARDVWAVEGIPLPPPDEVEWIAVASVLADQDPKIASALDLARRDYGFALVTEQGGVEVYRRG